MTDFGENRRRLRWKTITRKIKIDGAHHWYELELDSEEEMISVKARLLAMFWVSPPEQMFYLELEYELHLLSHPEQNEVRGIPRVVCKERFPTFSKTKIDGSSSESLRIDTPPPCKPTAIKLASGEYATESTGELLDADDAKLRGAILLTFSFGSNKNEKIRHNLCVGRLNLHAKDIILFR